SSRRRHTRFSRDWSSDVCSSDLAFDALFEDAFGFFEEMGMGGAYFVKDEARAEFAARMGGNPVCSGYQLIETEWGSLLNLYTDRSEERRVGKEGRSRGSPQEDEW